MTTSDATLASAPTEKDNGGKRRTRARKKKIEETDDVARPSVRRVRNSSKYSLEDLALALRALEAGDFQKRLPEKGEPILVEIARTFNRLTAQNQRVCDNVNAMAGNLRSRTTELARATSELESLNRELNRRTQDLERALNARSRFYASMSHELRTPINAILGYSSLLLDDVYGPLNESQVKGIERTHRAAKHLLELVNDVLDLSKIEAGKIELQLEPVSFPGLIEDLFVTVRPMADEHGSPLSLEHLGDPLTVVSDPRRVRQILLNLLSNAIKFGRGQPIRVVSQKWGDRGIEVQVIDQGVGIAAEDREKIFDEFVQLARDRHDGTGLALPISQRLAVILNGSLTVQSDVDVGSVFYLRLPRLADALATEPPEQRPAETAA